MNNALSIITLGGALLLASNSYAGPVERCQETQLDGRQSNYYPRTSGYRKDVPVVATVAVSRTLPAVSSTLRVEFQNNMDYYACVDSAANPTCGSARPVVETDDGWIYKPAGFRVTTVSNSVPTRMWLEGVTTNTVKFTACKEGN